MFLSPPLLSLELVKRVPLGKDSKGGAPQPSPQINAAEPCALLAGQVHWVSMAVGGTRPWDPAAGRAGGRVWMRFWEWPPDCLWAPQVPLWQG